MSNICYTFAPHKYKEMGFKELTEDEFDTQFALLNNQFDTNASFDGKLFETYGPELEFVLEMAKLKRVITVIEGDEEEREDEDEPRINMYYSSGFHLINRIGYFITDKPFEFEFDVKLD